MPLSPNSLTFRSDKDRPASDFFPTPKDVTHSLLQKLGLSKSVVLFDPACGDGQMLDVFKADGYRCWGNDLFQYPYRPDAIYGVDFLNRQFIPVNTYIITNPPFSQAEEFIRKALSLHVPFAFVLKSSYWNAAKRLELFYSHKPIAVWPLSWRPNFYEKHKRRGSPTMDVLVTVWGVEPAEKTEFDIMRRVKYVG